MSAITNLATFTLACHPLTPLAAIHHIDVVLREEKDDALSLTFGVEGDIPSVIIPARQTSHRADRLWQHTCFEFFVMSEDGRGYHEFNFSPSGAWAAYTFREYRQGGELDIELMPSIRVCRSASRLEIDARIHRCYLPSGERLKIGLSAVLEVTDGHLSYWALNHPPGKPDFHHAAAFAEQIEFTD